METKSKPYSKIPKITIDESGTIAKLRIYSPSADEEIPKFTKAGLQNFLMQAGVVYGINEQILSALADDPEYDHDVIVAQGEFPVQGANGYMEYHFSQDFSKKPKIREDGSADFKSIKVIEVVHEGDLIATYHPAIPGVAGCSVKGQIIEPAQVRDMPPLGGRGFHRDEDGVSYYADTDGKIVLQGTRVLISPVYEISQDADMSTGNIDFKGDVIIHGGVKNDIYIHATGSVTVDGLVESCEISAGKDIFLLSGVKGGEKTVIHAGGSITAEFIEYAFVSCKGNLQADVLFNCVVDCESQVITTSGKRSSIIGGTVTAVRGLATLSLGNRSGTATKVAVGVDEERMREMLKIRDNIEAVEENIAKIKKGVEDFDAISEKKGISNKGDPRRMQLLRVKIQDEAVVAHDRMRLEELENLLEGSKKATVKVYDKVYSDVEVKISGHHVHTSDYQKQVEFVRTETGIRMEPLLEPIPD